MSRRRIPLAAAAALLLGLSAGGLARADLVAPRPRPLVVPAASAAKPATPPPAPPAPRKPPPPAAGAGGAAGDAPADAGAALPAGHPPIQNGLPSGHPPVEGGDDDEEPAPDPHGGAAHGADPRFFDPPPDTAQDDPSLPPGVVVASIKDDQDRPVPRAPITVGVLHSSVAKGDSREQLSRDADDQGTVRFEGLTVGSGTTYRIATTRGPATFAEPPFGLNDRAGKRVVVHAYEVGTDIDKLFVGMKGRVHLTLKEDSIQIEQLLQIFNVGRVAWVPDLPLALPEGWKAFNKSESMEDARIDEVKGAGAALRGTFGPGRHDLDYRYQVPLSGEARQTVRIAVPPRVAQMLVSAEASKAMTLDVGGFPPSQRVTGNDGKRLLITQKQAARADGGLATLEITLTGLPTPGPGRWIALSLAGAALALGLLYVRQQPGGGAIDDDTRDDLREAREALLGEIVALERAHREGTIGPKTYARLREALLDALGRIMDQLDRGRMAAVETRGRRPRAEEPDRRSAR